MIRREILDAAWGLAREHGISQVTLREVAARVGMQAPSLYSHCAPKNAIYDAMFEQAWTDCHETMSAIQDERAGTPRAKLRLYARTFFQFAVADLARHQLMNQRTIPGFEPSTAGYAPAVAVMEGLRQRLRAIGITHDEDVDLYTALVAGCSTRSSPMTQAATAGPVWSTARSTCSPATSACPETREEPDP